MQGPAPGDPGADRGPGSAGKGGSWPSIWRLPLDSGWVQRRGDSRVDRERCPLAWDRRRGGAVSRSPKILVPEIDDGYEGVERIEHWTERGIERGQLAAPFVACIDLG